MGQIKNIKLHIVTDIKLCRHQNGCIFNRARKSNQVMQSSRFLPQSALQEHARNSSSHQENAHQESQQISERRGCEEANHSIQTIQWWCWSQSTSESSWLLPRK